MNILDQLWYGDLKPSQQYKNTPERKLLTREYSAAVAKLTALLSLEQQGTLDHLLDLYGSMASIDEHCAFVAGFKLGVQLTVAGMEKIPDVLEET